MIDTKAIRTTVPTAGTGDIGDADFLALWEGVRAAIKAAAFRPNIMLWAFGMRRVSAP